MSDFNTLNNEVVAMFCELEHKLKETGITYDLTLITGLDQEQPRGMHSTTDPLSSYRILSAGIIPKEDGTRVGRLVEYKEKVYPQDAHLKPDYTQLRHQSCTVHYTDNIPTSPNVDKLFSEVENITAILRGKDAN